MTSEQHLFSFIHYLDHDNVTMYDTLLWKWSNMYDTLLWKWNKNALNDDGRFLLHLAVNFSILKKFQQCIVEAQFTC